MAPRTLFWGAILTGGKMKYMILIITIFLVVSSPFVNAKENSYAPTETASKCSSNMLLNIAGESLHFGSLCSFILDL